MTDHKQPDEVYQQTQPQLCIGGCGFFGNAATSGMCSVCFRNHKNSAKESSAEAQSPAPKDMVETVTAQAQVAVPPPVPPPVPKGEEEAAPEPQPESEATGMETCEAVETEEAAAPAGPVVQKNHNRCFSCNKRVGFTGFKCRCEYTFCATHRHSNKHDCTFDYKAMGRESVAKANPAVIKDKVDSRI